MLCQRKELVDKQKLKNRENKKNKLTEQLN